MILCFVIKNLRWSFLLLIKGINTKSPTKATIIAAATAIPHFFAVLDPRSDVEVLDPRSDVDGGSASRTEKFIEYSISRKA